MSCNITEHKRNDLAKGLGIGIELLPKQTSQFKIVVAFVFEVSQKLFKYVSAKCNVQKYKQYVRIGVDSLYFFFLV